MSLSSVLHRLGQVERDLRHELTPPVAGEQLRCDYSYATDAELDRLCDLFAGAGVDHGHELVEPQRSEVESIVSAINERAEREPDWTPPVKRDLLEATAKARTEGRTILPVTDDLTVDLGFLLHGEEPEPNPLPEVEAIAPQPLEETLDEPEPVPARSEEVAEPIPPAPRPLSMIERAHASGRQRRWHGDDEAPTAAWILEREF